MFEMLLESGHRQSLLPTWGKGVALTLHVVILGALWRAPTSAPPVSIERGVTLPPVEPTTTRDPDLPRVPIIHFDGGIPLPPPPSEIRDVAGSTLLTSMTIPAFGRDSGTAPSLEPGDGVYLPSLVQDAPELLAAPTPLYPPLLRAAGVQGHVIVSAVVDTLGQAETGSVRIVLSDNPGFDAAALATVRAARFRPARIYGRAVRVLVQVPVVFRLN